MNKKAKKGVLYLTAGFIVLFCLRLLYGYYNPEAGRTGFQMQYQSGEFSVPIKNYATEFYKAYQSASKQEYTVDQKYEKIASLQSRTAAFDQDEARVRALAGKYHALVQYEQSGGLAGNRRLELSIGVVPVDFDDMVAETKAVGKLASIRIEKTDKSSEYKGLMAKKASLETTRQSLEALRGRADKVDALINLEDKLREVEDELQTLGVQLGEYSQENDFCTVRLTLLEGLVGQISLLHRISVALRWTIMLAGLLLAGTLLALSGVALWEKARSSSRGDAGQPAN